MKIVVIKKITSENHASLHYCCTQSGVGYFGIIFKESIPELVEKKFCVPISREALVKFFPLQSTLLANHESAEFYQVINSIMLDFITDSRKDLDKYIEIIAQLKEENRKAYSTLEEITTDGCDYALVRAKAITLTEAHKKSSKF